MLGVWIIFRIISGVWIIFRIISGVRIISLITEQNKPFSFFQRLLSLGIRDFEL